MDQELPDVLQLKFEGGGISPNDIRLSELARILRQLEEFLVEQVRTAEPSVKREEVHVALNSVRRSSAAFGVTSSMPEATAYAFYQFGKAVESNNYLGLAPSSRELAKQLVSFTRRHDCEARLLSRLHDGYAFKVTPETRVGSVRTIKGETQYYGVLERIGGAEPRFTLRISHEEKIRGEISTELAVDLAARLYSWVGISGVAAWDPLTGEVESFWATGVIPYRGTGIATAVDILKHAIGEYWDDEEEDELKVAYKIRRG